MIQGRSNTTASPIFSRRNCVWCAALALAAASLVVNTACDEEEAGRAFRDAASSSLQSGLKSITDGVIEGMFAVFDLGADQDGSGGTSSTSPSE